jgi:hypothetical protein
VIVNAPPLRATGEPEMLIAPGKLVPIVYGGVPPKTKNVALAPLLQRVVSGPVNVVVPVGMTDSTELPLTNCAIVNWPTTLLPSVISVARNSATCVAAFTGTTSRTVAVPF